jgi:hypothetical protein
MSPVTETSTIQANPAPIAWHSGLSVYASEPYLKSVGDEWGWLGGTDASGRLRCILPYTIIRKAFVRMVRFRVETIPLQADLGLEEEKSFLESAVKVFRAMGADLIMPASNNTIFRTYPDGAVAAPYGSYVLDLTQPEEALWENLHSKHRNVIRNATKKGVEIRCGLQYLETAHQLVQETLKRSSLGFVSLDELKRLVAGLGDQIRIFFAEHAGAPQGAAIIPFSGYSAYYLYGGSAAETVSGAMNLLQWEAIRHFRAAGVARYDFVGVRINPEKGSKQEGLKMFKERFGGTLREGYMWKMPLNRLKYPIYSLAVRCLRGGDVVDIERRRLPESLKSLAPV